MPYRYQNRKGLMRLNQLISTGARIVAALVCALVLQSSRADTTLIAANAEWRYGTPEDAAVNADWRDAFNDTNWKVGPAQLGYGDGDEATVIEARPPVVLFRKTFTVETPDAFGKLLLRLLRDDGAVVYLNGQEIVRSNMPDGPITPETMAVATVGAEDESRWYPYEVAASRLRTGLNVVAVEVHQVNVSSSDLSFALELIGRTEPVSRPTVSIVASQPETRESDALVRVAPGRFQITRTGGDLTLGLPVFLRYEGSAISGGDYTEIPTRIEFAPGEATKSLEVRPLDDFVKEPTETVVAILSPPPTSPDTIPYNIAEASRATVSIADSRSGIEITRPESGTIFKQGQDIEIIAVAVAMEGTIQRVHFVAGETLIGVSQPVFINPPEPGQPITHKIVWKNAPLGTHVVVARGAAENSAGTAGQTYTSQQVIIRVHPDSTLPVLSIEAKWATTSEPLPNALVTPGLFIVHRAGPTEPEFDAWFSLGGSATEGVDYDSVPERVHFAPGQTQAEIKILPKSDDLVEGDETVVAELMQPPTGSPVAIYTIDPQRQRAVVTIKDEDRPARATIEITAPREGAVLVQGQNVTIEATAIDPNGYISRVEFFVDGQSIGVSEIVFITAPEPGTPIQHSIEWKNILLGDHVLTAEAVLPDGVKVASPPVRVHVVHGDPGPAVVSIHKVIDMTDRPIPDADYAPDFFSIRRTGGTNDPLTVYIHVPEGRSDFATPSVDYKRLPNSVTIPAGERSVVVRVEAIDDTLVEGPEVVRVELVPIPPNTDPAMSGLYTIDPEHAAAEVTIQDNDLAPARVTLIVEALDSIASEVTVTASLDTAAFVIKRVSGPTDVAVNAQYEMSGTAENGVDYKRLTGSVEIPAGAERAVVQVEAIPDNLAEGEETVIIKLVPPACVAIAPPPPDCYLVGDRNSARAVILDMRDDAPGVKIIRPANGAVFALGQPIVIEAQASDREGIIKKLEILFDEHVLDTTDGDHIVTEWSQGDLGEHTITARATDGAGKVATASVKALIRETDAIAFVFRKLPPAYSPGAPFTVELRAEPPDGARAYAVEDQPPTGWTVSEISHEGRFDAVTGKVKFGPFTDTTDRVLRYRVTPPAGATGVREFAGVGSVDGVNYRIGGDHRIGPGESHHPADTNNDNRITVSELTAYAAEWKRGGVIPLSYVTRAGFIWRHGEVYKFDPAQQPPFCWVPVGGTTPTGGVAPSLGVAECERLGVPETDAGVSAPILLKVAPPAGTSAYAVEEKVPVGWMVTGISNEGSFDPGTGVIRWGMFLDSSARTLSYTLTPPPNVSAVARLGGQISFDGSVQEVYGATGVVSSDDTKLPTLSRCETDETGKVRLELSGAAGQVGVVQSSTDLIHWQDVATVYLPDGTVQIEDSAGASAAKYYRLQVR